MARFTSKRETCIKCKTSLPNGHSKLCICLLLGLIIVNSSPPTPEFATCEHCAEHDDRCFQTEILKIAKYEEKYAKLWTQCQRCQGSLLEEVICTSCDCPIFYMRKKILFELADQNKVVSRFGVPDW